MINEAYREHSLSLSLIFFFSPLSLKGDGKKKWREEKKTSFLLPSMMEDGWNGKVEREIKKEIVQVRNSTKND